MVDSTTELPDTEPQEISEGAPQLISKGTSGRKSFAKLRRELSDDELSSSAVQRMLIDEIERLDAERIELSSFRNRFHDSDKRAAILEERFKGKISIEIVHIACMTTGAAALGYAPSIWQAGPAGWMAAIFGVVLILAGLAAKAVKP